MTQPLILGLSLWIRSGFRAYAERSRFSSSAQDRAQRDWPSNVSQNNKTAFLRESIDAIEDAALNACEPWGREFERGEKPTEQLAAKDAEISKLNAAIEEWIPRHYLTDREHTIKKLTKQAAEQAAEDAIVLRESFPGLASVRRYWLFVLFLDAGLADFFFASPSRPPIRVNASAALNGN